jgi:hypothetical protein
VKSRYQVPPELQSCHTAIVDGYIIEGHVPVAEIERLLTERPDITGLAVPGMPIGSPGMEVDGADPSLMTCWPSMSPAMSRSSPAMGRKGSSVDSHLKRTRFAGDCQL